MGLLSMLFRDPALDEPLELPGRKLADYNPSTAIIHVNRSHIAMNGKDGGDRPVFTVKRDGKTRYGRGVVIHGTSQFVYDREGLKCGAKAWVETEADITIIDEMSFQEARNA